VSPNRDIIDVIANTVQAREVTSPWTDDAHGRRIYRPDHHLLTTLLSIPVSEGSASQSGRLAKAFDCWVATELRRAGFGADEVLPRIQRPCVLPRDVSIHG
jgi:hypothetical protein